MIKTHAFRLHAGVDLKQAIQAHVASHAILAGYVVTCVGGLSVARLRMPGATDFLDLEEDYEIVSVVGTLSPDGCHLHMSISDKQGQVLGGHMSTGCIVRLTAEVILAEDQSYGFHREPDDTTGYDELVVSRKGHH